jgi:hypothetical protein
MPVSNLFNLVKAKANLDQAAKYLNEVYAEPQKTESDSKLILAARVHERAYQNFLRLGGSSLDLVV